MSASKLDPMPTEDLLVEACLSTLRGLGPSVEVSFVFHRDPTGSDGKLRVSLGRRVATYVVEVTRTHLSYALASGLIGRRSQAPNAPLALFAPYVPGTIGKHLAANQLSYVDAIGNCHLLSEKHDLLVHVEGKKPERDTVQPTGGRVPSHQLVFALLAKSDLLEKPVREIAEAAGIGKTATAAQLNRLTEQGLLSRTRSGTSILRQRDLQDRWLSAYSDAVRPTWLIGRYRTRSVDPEELEAKIKTAWEGHTWAFGGGAAAWRMTPFYRGPETVLHVRDVPIDALRQLHAIPSRDGALTILRTPGTVAYSGIAPNLAHPFLVYTEMVTSRDPRMAEAAANLHDRFLTEQT